MKCTLSPPLCLIRFLSFSLLSLSPSLSLSIPKGWGVSCNLSIGFSRAYPVTCCPSNLFLFLPDKLSFHIHVSLPAVTRLELSVFLLFLLFSLLGFLSFLSLCCSMFVTGQLGRKEGRLMATEILSDSGPVQAVPVGSMCFLPLWNAREHPSTVLTLRLSTDWTFTHWERAKRCFAIIRKKKPTHTHTRGVEVNPASAP